MLIALAVPALIFVVGLGIMMRNEERCMKPNKPSAMFYRRHP